MPGREREYEAFKALQAQSGGAPPYVPPPIDAERRSRSPGLQNNFYEVPMADFKRPHGMPRSAPPSPALEAPPPTATPAPAQQASSPAAGHGTETPMPGREREYEAFKALQAQSGGAPPYVPPPIDAERRSRSPGLQNNFYEVPMADFKRPHGMPPTAELADHALAAPAKSANERVTSHKAIALSTDEFGEVTATVLPEARPATEVESVEPKVKAAAPEVRPAEEPTAMVTKAAATERTAAQFGFVPPPLGNLPALLTQAAQHESRAASREAQRIQSIRARANVLFQEQMSAIDVTKGCSEPAGCEILPDFDTMRAECLKQAEQEVGSSADLAAVERMREARAAMVDAASAFADSVARLDADAQLSS